jgi:hypothetical protein
MPGLEARRLFLIFPVPSRARGCTRMIIASKLETLPSCLGPSSSDQGELPSQSPERPPRLLADVEARITIGDLRQPVTARRWPEVAQEHTHTFARTMWSGSSSAFFCVDSGCAGCVR